LHSTAGFKLVCVSKLVLEDLKASGIVQKIQINNGKQKYLNVENKDTLFFQSDVPRYDTRVSVKDKTGFIFLKSVTIDVNCFLAEDNSGVMGSLQEMIALQTIVVSGEIFTDHNPKDMNELIDINMDFNLVLVAEHRSGNEFMLQPSWTNQDGKIFKDRAILMELELQLICDFQ